MMYRKVNYCVGLCALLGTFVASGLGLFADTPATVSDPYWGPAPYHHHAIAPADLENGRIQFANDNIAEARRFLIRAEAVHPADAGLLGLLAETYIIDDELGNARDCLERGLALDSAARNTTLQVAEICMALKTAIAERESGKRRNLFQLAASAAQAHLRRIRTDGGEHDVYAAFYLWLSDRELGDGSAAEIVLDDCLARTKKNDPWDYEGSITAKFLRGLITEESYLQLASRDLYRQTIDLRCQCYFYIAARDFLAGDLPSARVAFEKSVSTGKKHLPEWMLAAAFLRQLSLSQPSRVSAN